MQDFFNDNLEFYHYYRRGATFLDEYYFVRGKIDIRLFPSTFSFYIDDKFSTSHDNTVATIIAYDMLIVYLKTEIDKLENNNSMEINIDSYQKQSRSQHSRNHVLLEHGFVFFRSVNNFNCCKWIKNTKLVSLAIRGFLIAELSSKDA